MIYSGTSNLVLPFPKYAFPEAFRDKSRLAYYASLFNSIEINSTFKKIPRSATLHRWSSEVPDGFRFTFKMPAAITHNKDLIFSNQEINDFIKLLSGIGNKKGCLLVQFPGKITNAHMKQLKKLLRIIRKADPKCYWKTAVEFRNRSWYDEDLYQLLEKYNMSLVLHDMPASAPELNVLSSDFIYLRLHGPEKGYRGSYADDFLYSYSLKIREWNDQEKDVYIYFNNTLGDAYQNLVKLMSMIYTRT